MSMPTLVAHRGNAAEFPENTLPALDSAVALGLRHVEFDVQLARDRVPVLLHDADLSRVGGRPERIVDLDWSDFARLPVGEPGRLGPEFAATLPSSLEQAVDWLGGRPGVTAFVEVKRASLRHFGMPAVIEQVIAKLRPVLEQAVLISFDLPCLLHARAESAARIGWVLTQYDDASRLEARAAAPEFLFCNHERLPPDGSQLWSGPWEWALYEVRDVDTARTLRERGAAYAETMAVRTMLAACASAGNPRG